MKANEDHRALLSAARAALDAGNVESAQRMTQQILAEEPYTTEAWYLLSLIAVRWEDQIACLKNALAADPEFHEAAERLEELRQQELPATLGRRETTVPLLEEARREELSKYIVESTLEPAGDPLDDPLQCPYCGTVNPVENQECARCGRTIVFYEPKAEEPSQYLKVAIILAGAAGILGLFEIGTPALWSWFNSELDSHLAIGVGATLSAPLATALFGDVSREGLLSTSTATLLLGLGIARMVLIGVGWFSAYNRWRWGYYAGSAASMADLALQAVLGVSGLAGRAVTVVAAALSLAGAISLFGARSDFAMNKVRIAVDANRRTQSADAFFRLGTRFKKTGMWALAVANWRAAVGRAPQRAEFYKWLGIGYIQLGRYDRALPVLEEGHRLEPKNADFDELMDLVQDIIARKKREERGDVIAPLS
jgi:tetratricopeptide (TPR) repeat protein